MYIALFLALITGFLVSKKRYGWATAVGMMFLYYLWANLLALFWAFFMRRSF